VDDSAVILMVLAEAAHDDAAAREHAIKQGANWVMGMQSKDGGFAAFDVDNNSEWLNQTPFADLEAATDDLRKSDWTRVRNDGGGGLSRRPFGGAPGDNVAQTEPGKRRFVVGPLGRRLGLRAAFSVGNGLAIDSRWPVLFQNPQLFLS
jgi:hypothetical protein